jgi:serine O-acetyltransferase
LILFNQGFIFTTVFRINTKLYSVFRRVPVIRKIVGLHCLIWLKISQIITGISLPVGLRIGRGIFISHAGTIIINGASIIGENVNLGPDTVIGYAIRHGVEGNPNIGDRVFIGPGAKIFSPITIGNDVMIGANAVVIDNVPDKAVVAGVPAKIVSMKGSGQYVKFFD